MLDQLAAQLNLSKGELLRTALDYWLENSPDAKQAMRALRGK
jgi:hypothetical protein